jgi:hypothetical protein
MPNSSSGVTSSATSGCATATDVWWRSPARVTVEVEVALAEHFQVVGIGAVLVTASERGRGLVWELLRPLLEIAAEMGPERAMLFCRPQLTGMYGRLGFAEIAGPTWIRQPDGVIEMPLRTMWRPLREGVGWPSGRVEVLGLPF